MSMQNRGRRLMLAVALGVLGSAAQAAEPFHLEETTIADIHRGIQSGAVSCRQIVEAYVARARAYNGMCTALVTPDGRKAPAVKGTTRAGLPLKFPTQTVSIRELLPDFGQYSGATPDYGRMEPTQSDPGVYQQYGMVVGIPHARQVNALETLNLRGERSVTCKGKFDAPPGKPLPAGAPSVCEDFRQQPDALETAAALDAQYGRNPDLQAMPLYCVPMSFKAVYNAKDMRSTGGGDVAYAMDAAPADSTLTARMRAAGAIIYAQAHNSEYNGGSGDPGGDAKVERPYIGTGGARETWGGTVCNPYDTTRETGGSSGGSGASVAANLVVCSICETTGGSCRNPANLNGVVNLVPTKGTISYAGGIGANPYQDRPGILCRTVKDAVTILDAFRDQKTGRYFDPADPYTAITHMTAADTPYVGALSRPGSGKPLAGVRIGVVREFMRKKTPSAAPVSDGVNAQLKVLQALGAELIEAVDPEYPDDPSLPNMAFGFEDALAEVIPFHMPEVLSWKKADGTPEFAVPGWDVTSREYLVAASLHKAPWPANLNLLRIIGNPPEHPDAVSGYTFSFQFAQYLLARGDARVHDWQTLNANAKYFSDAKRAAAKNWENKAIDIRTDAITYTMKRRDTVRMAVMKVMEQNRIDVFVNPSSTVIAQQLGGPGEPERRSFGYGATLGLPEVFVPGGFIDTVYDPRFVLGKDGRKYDTAFGSAPAKPGSPLPFNVGFWAAPGDEATVIKVASAYEAATRHRRPPPDFGPLKGEP
ncbi:amidase family protein [Solimonas flava]|uniref:amidase family protein n=1 Tax=Solimonas flava TaxID=415849 RepID=UPI00041EB54B|nr:amidase family protein [Solimonas flava]